MARLASNASLSEREKVAAASRAFEAVLLRHILSEAQKPMFKSAVAGGGGLMADVYRDLITNQMAESISSGGSLGLATSLEAQLQRQLNTVDPSRSSTTRGDLSTTTPKTTGASHVDVHAH